MSLLHNTPRLTDARETEHAGRDHLTTDEERVNENEERRERKEEKGTDSGWYDVVPIL